MVDRQDQELGGRSYLQYLRKIEAILRMLNEEYYLMSSHAIKERLNVELKPCEELQIDKTQGRSHGSHRRVTRSTAVSLRKFDYGAR